MTLREREGKRGRDRQTHTLSIDTELLTGIPTHIHRLLEGEEVGTTFLQGNGALFEDS